LNAPQTRVKVLRTLACGGQRLRAHFGGLQAPPQAAPRFARSFLRRAAGLSRAVAPLVPHFAPHASRCREETPEAFAEPRSRVKAKAKAAEAAEGQTLKPKVNPKDLGSTLECAGAFRQAKAAEAKGLIKITKQTFAV